MNSEKRRISSVPTNIITGFLGAGKTTSILHLLTQKPVAERWAVLVNEFGDIGIDGSLYQGNHTEVDGVFIREVPGGCMCCTAGLPMQIALNQLLQRARPDRLLIEPTGLGHPVEILQTLADDHYRPILRLQKILALVDARQIADTRYTSHDIFNQQISIADVIVGNKQDLYRTGDAEALEIYARKQNARGAVLRFTDHGKIGIDWLTGDTAAIVSHHSHHDGGDAEATMADEQSLPERGVLRAENAGAGFRSIGWRFAPSTLFDHRRLVSFLGCITAQRMKAVFITDSGVFGYNLTPDALTEMAMDDALESRMEIIDDEIDTSWEPALMDCVIDDA